MLRVALLAFVTLALGAPTAGARVADDSRDVRVKGTCAAGAEARLRLTADDGRIEVRLELEQRHTGVAWRVTLVHERRVVWRTTARTAAGKRRVELRRMLTDLAGSDAVTAQAWGPRGLTCRATATLPDAG